MTYSLQPGEILDPNALGVTLNKTCGSFNYPSGVVLDPATSWPMSSQYGFQIPMQNWMVQEPDGNGFFNTTANYVSLPSNQGLAAILSNAGGPITYSEIVACWNTCLVPNDSLTFSFNNVNYVNNQLWDGSLANNQFTFWQPQSDGTWQISTTCGLPTKQAVIINMTISGVSSSNGTIDYFKYDPDPSSPYHASTVSFTLADKSADDIGPSGYPYYKCWLFAVPTAVTGTTEYPTFEEYSCWSSQDGFLGKNTIAAGASDWGTYTYDIMVQKWQPNGEQDYLPTPTDTLSFKAPYCLTILNINHNVWEHDNGNTGQAELRCNYETSYYPYIPLSQFTNPNVTMTAVDDALNEQGTLSDGGVIGQFYNGMGDGELVKTQPNGSNFGGWRVIFTSEDPNSGIFRRDHTVGRILAVNKNIGVAYIVFGNLNFGSVIPDPEAICDAYDVAYHEAYYCTKKGDYVDLLNNVPKSQILNALTVNNM